MKPFNLELAKAGHPVQTRDGKHARIVCYDRISTYYPIVALVKSLDNSKEDTWHYTLDGKFSINLKDDDLDLVMTTIKKEGWVNVYKSANNTFYTRKVYISKETAIDNIINFGDTYVATTKIEWEE